MEAWSYSTVNAQHYLHPNRELKFLTFSSGCSSAGTPASENSDSITTLTGL
jgi:hypothetical protein